MKPVCLITGVAGRLGQALCQTLHEEFDLAGTYRHTLPAALQDGSVHLIQADLTCRNDIARIIETTMARYGRIDALINSAADLKFHGSLRNLWLANDYPQSQLMLNAIAPMQLASAIYQQCWKEQNDTNTQWNRSIVNVSSISGLYVFQERGQAFYGVSKAALNMLTLYLALELAPFGIRVNAICPSQFTSKSATGRVASAIRNLLIGNATGTIVTGVP